MSAPCQPATPPRRRGSAPWPMALRLLPWRHGADPRVHIQNKVAQGCKYDFFRKRIKTKNSANQPVVTIHIEGYFICERDIVEICQDDFEWREKQSDVVRCCKMAVTLMYRSHCEDRQSE